MSELSSEIPLFNEEEQAIIDVERAKVMQNDPTLEITDGRLLEMYNIAQRAAQIGAKATIESDGN